MSRSNTVCDWFGLFTSFAAKYDERFKGGDVSIGFDLNSLSVNYRNDVIADFIGQWNADATGAYAIWNATGIKNIYEEGVHIWQSRFFNELFLPTFFWNSLPAIGRGLHYYRGNFFEDQAHGYYGFTKRF